MGNRTIDLPDGFELKSPEWHFKKFVEFTELKREIGEPSPHLAMVGWMSKDSPMDSRLWLLGCYGATYCLPSAQVLWEQWSIESVLSRRKEFSKWLHKNFAGIITRTERRCVRTPDKMEECLVSYATWAHEEYPKLTVDIKDDPIEQYDHVWKSVTGVKYYGRYIAIRVIEGLNRYCNVPASLYDVRSVGGWSPKKCMAFLYPDQADNILQENKEANALMDSLVEELIDRVSVYIPEADSYRIAAMLCEYKGAFEKRHQYPGWTIDQEPLLYDKTIDYWGDDMNKKLMLDTRENVFPWEVLGEVDNRWNGTRWELTKTLRDYGYNWSDLDYDYMATLKSGDFSKPVIYQ